MNRAEFIQRLEILLQDISEEERTNALEYYTDYLEEAGEQEEQAILELGSPEKVASIIKTNLLREAQDRTSDGEFTENGYQTPEFDEKYKTIVQHQTKQKQRQSADYHRTTVGNVRIENKSSWTTGKIILCILLLLVALPLLLGITKKGIWLISTVLFLPVALVVASLALCFCGILFLGAGIVELITIPVNGVYIMGIGFCFMGIGLFLGYGTTVLCKKMIPIVKKLFYKIKEKLSQQGGDNDE